MAKPFISVVMRALNAGHFLPVSLRALEEQRFERSAFECIVVDDGSTDGTSDLLNQKKWQINLTPICNRHTLGPSISRNLGWKNAQGELVVFLDADMIPGLGWLESYADAFLCSKADVISGAISCLQPDWAGLNVVEAMAQLADVASNEFLGKSFETNFSQLLLHATPCRHLRNRDSNFDMRWPDSHEDRPVACGYSLLGANMAIKKESLNAIGGFYPLLHHGEDLDLGIRMAESGYVFRAEQNARAYHLACSGSDERSLTHSGCEALLYLHPYRSLAVALLRGSIPPAETSSSVTRVSIDSEFSNYKWQAFLEELSPSLLPGTFTYSETEIIDLFAQSVGIGREIVQAYLQTSVSDGLMVRHSPSRTYFDVHHTGNWLKRRTTFLEYALRDGSYARIHPTAIQCGGPGAKPFLVHCHGHYSIELDKTSKLLSDGLVIQMALPISHRCQDVNRIRLFPEQLEAYVNREIGILAAPSCIWRQSYAISYEFECDIKEEPFSGVSVENEYDDARGSLSPYLRFTYPSSYLEKAKSLLDYILGQDHVDPEKAARRIYDWIVENLCYFSSPLPDYAILDTGIGDCVQMTRLFANLARLKGIAVKEQCGALLERMMSAVEVGFIRGEYSPFAHTWADVYFEGRGWRQVDFLPTDCNRWQLTELNAGREMRSEMRSEAARRTNYYFGSVDPYRIYGSEYSNKIFPISGKGRNPRMLNDVLPYIRHRLSCEVEAHPFKTRKPMNEIENVP